MMSFFPGSFWYGLIQRQIIFPGHLRQGKPASVVQPPADAELIPLRTAGGERIVAMYGGALTANGDTHPNADRCPTIVYFYGNAMCLVDTVAQFGRIRRLGANVLIPELVGYGMSSGVPSEQGCYDTAEAAYQYVQSRDDIDPAKIVAMGWSLGSGIAVQLACRHKTAALLIFSSFTSMRHMAAKQYPFFPTSLILQHHFDNERKLATFDGPVFIAHGKQDRLVPSEMSRRLAAIAASRGCPVTRIVIDEAKHEDLFRVGGEQIRAELRRFLGRLGEQTEMPEGKAA
ncbi:MAG: alpha/beta hydrolase [Bacillota bacterium]